MIRLAGFPSRAAMLVGLLVAPLVLTSCDLASTGGTVILNANLPNPPTIDYRFKYSQSDATDAGQVNISGMVEDDLYAILEDNGVNRRQVVSARVDSVKVKAVDAPALTGAKLYLGTDASGPLLGEVQLGPAQERARDTETRSVTEAVKDGEEDVFGRFRVDEPGNIPPGGSVVRATVYYRIKAK